MISSIRILLTGMSRMFNVHIIITYRYILEKYYTDVHDVDENERANSQHGGMWHDGSDAGVAYRALANTFTDIYDVVASMCRHPKYSSNYTDQHNVDEDMVTISCIGEHWCGAAFAGLHCRHIDWPVYWYTNDVASKK